MSDKQLADLLRTIVKEEVKPLKYDLEFIKQDLNRMATKEDLIELRRELLEKMEGGFEDTIEVLTELITGYNLRISSAQ